MPDGYFAASPESRGRRRSDFSPQLGTLLPLRTARWGGFIGVVGRISISRGTLIIIEFTSTLSDGMVHRLSYQDMIFLSIFGMKIIFLSFFIIKFRK